MVRPPNTDPELLWPPGGRLEIQGHRGARGYLAENTIPSFQHAVAAGVSGLELDVRLTADHEVIVWHDPTVQADKCLPTGTDFRGARLDELTLEQLHTIDVGSLVLPDFPEQRPVPGLGMSTLSDVLAACDHPELWWTIELKVNPTDPREVATRDILVNRVLQITSDAGITHRCFIHSFDWAVLELSRTLAPTVLRSALAVVGETYRPESAWLGSIRWDDHGDDLPGAVAELGAAVVSPHFRGVTADFVSRSHQCGIAVLVWTVNTEEDAVVQVKAGVDGIVTDYPGRLLELTQR